MESIFTSDLLALVQAADARPTPLALLCLATGWGAVEQQTLELATALHRGGRPLTLVVTPESPLHDHALGRGLPCHPRRVRWAGLNLPAAATLARWLRREQVGVLLTTATADLALARLVRGWAGDALRLVHRQLEALPARSRPWLTWWMRQQAAAVDAWVVPLPAQARLAQARCHLSLRRLWVVPPALPGLPADDAQPGTRAEARHLLDLPATAPLIGMLDCGEDGPAFAVEALYRLATEHQSAAELVVLGGPDTPPAADRWAALRQLAAQLHLSHRLHLRPLHNSSHPLLFYRALDVLLLPAPANARGAGLLRAMHAGCPLVSVRAADAEDLLEDGYSARLFARHDVGGAAHALHQTLSALPAARQRAARTAALIARQCSPARQGQQLDSIIQYASRPRPVA